ncbi:hypothetical protein [Candidatus Lokiarchaeum ossiferum]|uniref:hypothetical protein n=1 Tax=Candidatus Lokiarchaeum ossiferum TaxID=2951803 RepID=UPI00352EF9B3
MLFQLEFNPLFYVILELGIFLLSFGFAIVGALKVKKQKQIFKLIALLFLLTYSASIFVSTMMRYIRYAIAINPSSIYATNTNYVYLLLKEARLKYILILSANLLYFIFFHYYLSRPQSFVFHFGINISSITIVLHFIPLFSEYYKLFLRILMFIQTASLILPILITSVKLKSKMHNKPKKVVQSIFLISLSLISLLGVGLLDAIVSIIFSWEFSVFYYIAWLLVLFAEFFFLFQFILTDWNETYTNISKQNLYLNFSTNKNDQILMDSSSPISKYIWITCPKCKEMTLYPISMSTRKIIKTNPSGISSLMIPRGYTCEHEYLIYIDREFQVRSYHIPNITFDKKKE